MLLLLLLIATYGLMALLIGRFLRRNSQSGLDPLAGRWYCTYRPPLIVGSRQPEALDTPPRYIVNLEPDGNGSIVRAGAVQPTPAYFCWTCRANHLIIDSEDWTKSTPLLFRLNNPGKSKQTLTLVSEGHQNNQKEH